MPQCTVISNQKKRYGIKSNSTHFYSSLNDELRSVIKSFCAGINHSFVTFFFCLINVFIDFLLMSRELRMNKGFVQNWRAFGHWTQQPEDNANFDFVIEWKPGQKDITECFNCNEAREDDPVHHPSDIFFDIFSTNRFIGAISWVECAENKTKKKKK